MVLLLRLSPLVPFGLLNYMLGLTGIPALSFILCSWLGMLPGAHTFWVLPRSQGNISPHAYTDIHPLACSTGTLAYVYLGSIGSAAQSGLSPAKLTLYVIGGIATLGASKVIADIAGQQMRDDDNSPEQAQLRQGDADDP